MNNDLIIRVKYDGNIYDLDVENNVPLRIDMSTVEVGEIGRLFGIGSQTFTLPGTKNNNKFFKNAYDIGADNPPAMYNSIDGWVIQNGETLLYGQFQLVEVVTDENKFVSYNVQLSDKAIQFAEAIKGKFVKDADWSAYTHTLDSGSIVNSWSGNLLGGKVFYPLAEYGRPEDEQDSSPYPYLGYYSGSMGTELRPIQVEQFLPAVKVKDALSVIFDQVGFRYTGSFFEKPEMSNLYMLTKANDDFGPVVPSASATFSAFESLTQNVPLGSTRFVTASIESFDTQNAYNPTTSTYTAQATGNHTLEASVTFPNNAFVTPGPDGENTGKVTLQLRAGSTSAYTVVATEEVFYDSDSPTFITVAASGEISMTAAADDFFAVVTYEQVFGTGTLGTLNITSANLRCTNAPASYKGATVNMADQFNPELKSEDVIKALTTQFNLVMVPAVYDQATIQIETFDDWIRSGGQLDWTDKFDAGKRISINHTINELPKKVILTQAEDNDRLSKLTKEQEPYRQYGSLELFATSNNAVGEEKLETVFAPTILGGVYDASSLSSSSFDINTSATTVYPHLYKYENDKILPYGFKPRLGFRVNNAIPSGSKIYIGDPSGGDPYTGYALSGSYGTLSNLSQLPGVPGSTIDLHFNNTYDDFGATVLNFNSAETAFTRYWKTYYDSLYWDDSKKVTMDVQFDPYEYKNIKLNDKILVKNQYYRINKIKGFNVSKRDVVTVELVRLYPAYYQPSFQQGVIPSPTPQPSGASPTPTPSISQSPGTPTPSPTISVTPSSGSIVTPTPTVSPTPSTSFQLQTLQISAGSTNKNQCAAPFTGSVYTGTPMNFWTEYGQVVYTDPGLTTRFDGGNRYHRITDSVNDSVWSINSSGIISEQGPDCAGISQFWGNSGYLTSGQECFGITDTARYSGDFDDVNDIQIGDRIYADSSLTYELNDGWYYGLSNTLNGTPEVAFEYSLIAGVTSLGDCDAGIPVSMSSYAFTATDACQDTSPEFLAYVPQGSDPYNMPSGSRFYSNPQLTEGFGLNGLFYGVYSGSDATPLVWYQLEGSDPFNGFVIDSASCGFENAYSASRDEGSTIGGEGCYNDMPFTIYMRKPLVEIVATGSGTFYDNQFASIVFPGNSGRYSLMQEGTAEYSGSRAIFTINSSGQGTLVEVCGERYSFRGKGYLTDGQECINEVDTSYYTMDFTTVQDVQEGDRIYLNEQLNTELLDGYFYGISDTSGSLPEKAFEYSLIAGVTNLGSCDAGIPISMSSYAISAFEACQDTSWEFTAYIPSGSDPYSLQVGDFIYDNPQLTSPFGLNNVYYGIYTSSLSTPLNWVRLTNGEIIEVSSCGEATVYSGSTTEGSTTGGEGCFNPPSSSIYFGKPLEQIIATGSGLFYNNAIASVAFPGNSGRYTLHQSGSTEYSEARAIFTINSSGQGTLYEVCGTEVFSFFGTSPQALNVNPCDAPLNQTIYSDEIADATLLVTGSRLYTNATLSNELADNSQFVISNISASNGTDAGLDAIAFRYSLLSGVTQIIGSCSPSSSQWYGTSPTSIENACDFTSANTYYTSGSYDIFGLVGQKLYTDAAATDEINVNNLWIGLGYDPSPATADVRVFYVSGSGITQLESCNKPLPSATPTASPTPSTSAVTPTPTPSVTATPSPTPSRTPDPLNTYDASSGQSLQGIVCGLSTTQLLYSTRSNIFDIQVGDIIYGDTSYTPFDGSSLYYGMGTGNVQIEVRINSVGSVLSVGTCPTPTPSPTPINPNVIVYRNETGYSTTTDACDNRLVGNYQQNYIIPSFQNLAAGDYVYADTSGTKLSITAGNYIIEDTTSTLIRVVYLESDGYISAIGTCPCCPDPTPTPTPSPSLSATPTPSTSVIPGDITFTVNLTRENDFWIGTGSLDNTYNLSVTESYYSNTTTESIARDVNTSGSTTLDATSLSTVTVNLNPGFTVPSYLTGSGILTISGSGTLVSGSVSQSIDNSTTATWILSGVSNDTVVTVDARERLLPLASNARLNFDAKYAVPSSNGQDPYINFVNKVNVGENLVVDSFYSAVSGQEYQYNIAVDNFTGSFYNITNNGSGDDVVGEKNISTGIIDGTNTDYTFQSWFYITGSTTNNKVFEINSSATGGTNLSRLSVGTIASGSEMVLRISGYGTGVGDVYESFPDKVIQPNTWYFVSLTRNGDNWSDHKLYLNDDTNFSSPTGSYSTIFTSTDNQAKLIDINGYTTGLLAYTRDIGAQGVVDNYKSTKAYYESNFVSSTPTEYDYSFKGPILYQLYRAGGVSYVNPVDACNSTNILNGIIYLTDPIIHITTGSLVYTDPYYGTLASAGGDYRKLSAQSAYSPETQPFYAAIKTGDSGSVIDIVDC